MGQNLIPHIMTQNLTQNHFGSNCFTVPFFVWRVMIVKLPEIPEHPQVQFGSSSLLYIQSNHWPNVYHNPILVNMIRYFLIINLINLLQVQQFYWMVIELKNVHPKPDLNLQF